MTRICWKHWLVTAAAGAALLALPGGAQQGGAAKNVEWPLVHGDPGSMRYSPLDQIRPDNVKNLKIAWIWRSDNFGPAPEYKNETTPVMRNGVLYFTAGSRRTVVAADPATGETIWVARTEEGARYEKGIRKNHRGVAFWEDRGEPRVFTVTPGFQLVSLNARTGQLSPGFGREGVVDLMRELGVNFDPTGTIGNTSPPVVSQGVVIVGPALPNARAPKKADYTKGDVMAFDARTGKKLWTFHTIPRRGEFGADTWRNGSNERTGHGGLWTTFSVDEELGYAYLPIEGVTGDSYGGHRPGDNLFASSLVAVEIKTGRRVWHQQLVHHDLWDYDPPAAPILGEVTVNGVRVKAVFQLTKMGFVFAFDRATGRPLWPIEERPVPQSDVPGEATSPTQPFPSKPPPFERQGVSEADLIDFTPELRQKALAAVKGYRLGPLYTPPSLVGINGSKGTFTLPGSGGANWEGGAFDPETGILYVGSAQRMDTAIYALTKGDPAITDFPYMGIAGGAPSVDGLPIIKPPYGRITAIDMNKGEIVWQVANGDTPPQIRDHPALKGVNLPRTGSPSRAGTLVTKTLLFAGEGYGGQPVFRAYDKRTGAILWETRIPAGPQTGLPMTYLHQGRQYVVFAAAGDPATQTPAMLVAYALDGGNRPAAAPKVE
jgi:quinoprotein glucose dehydrogenase